MTASPAILVALAILMGVAVARTVQQLRLMMKDPDSVTASHHLFRAIRGFILVACGGVFMAAVVLPSNNLAILGAIVLAEEIYETGLVSLVLRAETAAD